METDNERRLKKKNPWWWLIWYNFINNSLIQHSLSWQWFGISLLKNETKSKKNLTK